MNAIAFRSWILILLVAPLAFADEAQLDIRDGVPTDAYIAVYGQHNPERDYQRAYGEEIWQTIKDEELPERVVGLVMDRLPGEQREAVTSVSEELRSIFDSVDWSAVAESTEVAYAQVMDMPQTHHLVLVRLPSEDAAVNCETALKMLFQMIEQRSGGAVKAVLDEAARGGVHTLSVPNAKEFPFQPAFSRIDDVLIASTSPTVIRASIESLLSGGESKFDDPRLHAALEELPEPEDAIVFYDARQQFETMRNIGQFIRQKAGEDANAVRFAALFEKAVNEFAILDNEVTVEYTDGHRNIKKSLGQLAPDAEGKLLYRVCTQGDPFENWQRWVPADAQAFTLFTGANLHALYEEVTEFIRNEIPEAAEGLDKFEKAQAELGVHLDRDIFQVFSGETVSVTLPAASPTVIGGQDNVVALRCHQPERIRELIGQCVEGLAENPYVKSQQLRLTPSEDLEGFDEVSVNLLAMFGVRPVIGFHDGWMIFASNASVAKTVLDTLAGDAPAIDTTENFARFGLEVEGPVYALSYTDLAASTRQAAQFIRQAGAVAPAIVGIVGAKSKPEELEPLQEALAWLPSIANVVEKCDYLEAKLSVVQQGETPGTYVKQCVTLVRPPEEKAADEADDQNASLETNRQWTAGLVGQSALLESEVLQSH